MKLKKGIADLSFIIMIACDRNCNIEFARNKNLSSVAIYKCAHDARDKKILNSCDTNCSSAGCFTFD